MQKIDREALLEQIEAIHEDMCQVKGFINIVQSDNDDSLFNDGLNDVVETLVKVNLGLEDVENQLESETHSEDEKHSEKPKYCQWCGHRLQE